LKGFKNERAYENAHAFLWLLKDTSWRHSWRFLGMVMIVPTLAVQMHLTWRSRHDLHEVFHSIAVACWIAANAIWMSGEFFRGDSWRPGAQWLFSAGLVTMFFSSTIPYTFGITVRACSSVGQSGPLLTDRPRVRSAPGVPFCFAAL